MMKRLADYVTDTRMSEVSQTISSYNEMMNFAKIIIPAVFFCRTNIMKTRNISIKYERVIFHIRKIKTMWYSITRRTRKRILILDLSWKNSIPELAYMPSRTRINTINDIGQCPYNH